MLRRGTGNNAVNITAVCLAVNLAFLRLSPALQSGISRLFESVGIDSGSRAFSVLLPLCALALTALSVLVPSAVLHRFGDGSRGIIRLRPELPVHPVYMLMLGVSATVMLLFFFDAYENLLHFAGGFAESFPEKPIDMVFFFVRVVLLPPILFEPFFRGLVMERLLPFGSGFAVLVCAIAGAFPSSGLFGFAMSLAVGLLCGYFVLQTGSLTMGVFMHACCALTYFVYSFIKASGFDMSHRAAFFIITALVFLIGIFSCLRIDEQLSSGNTRSLGMRDKSLRVTDCLGAPCMLAYYLVVILTWK